VVASDVVHVRGIPLGQLVPGCLIDVLDLKEATCAHFVVEKFDEVFHRVWHGILHLVVLDVLIVVLFACTQRDVSARRWATHLKTLSLRAEVWQVSQGDTQLIVTLHSHTLL